MARGTWCESCGSSVPAGYDSCPVCGMPLGKVAGGDEPANETPPGVAEAVSPEPDEPRVNKDQRVNTKLAFVAACVALCVVGGAALIITRPWDPNPYSISATEDADTSMEGFPGKKGHLDEQDRTEQNQYLLLNELDVLLVEVDAGEDTDEELVGRLDEAARAVRELDIVDTDMAARRESLLERYDKLQK